MKHFEFTGTLAAVIIYSLAFTLFMGFLYEVSNIIQFIAQFFMSKL